MAKRKCELCQSEFATEMFFGVELCKSCESIRSKAMSGDPNATELICNPSTFPRATGRAITNAVEPVRKKVKQLQAKQKEEEERAAAERKRQEFAQSFNEFYEYDVVTIINENHGTIDKTHMMKVLADHAAQGWKLHSVYSNELGKNALSVLGLGVNSTACEDVLIFERRVERL